MMKSQDIVIIFKIHQYGEMKWTLNTIAADLNMSKSVVSYSLKRLEASKLLNMAARRPNCSNLQEFILFGFKYIFHWEPGKITRGMATARPVLPGSSRVVEQDFVFNNKKTAYVWPTSTGEEKGATVEPLHPCVPEICLHNKEFYQIFSMLDVLRLSDSRKREIEYVKGYIQKILD
jgi:hypothetical protein